MIFDWFEDWPGTGLSCGCEWCGPLDRGATQVFADLLDFACPECGEVLAIVHFPTAAHIEAAAGRGHSEALEMLGRVRDAQRAQQVFERRKLRSPDQLPDLAGDALDCTSSKHFGPEMLSAKRRLSFSS